MGSNDLRLAVRNLGRSPSFALAVILTLAISIGAVTAALSIAKGVLFEKLPYPDVERLVMLSNSFGELAPNESSYMDIQDWYKGMTVFDRRAMVMSWPNVNLTDGDRTERVRANFIEPSYFELLGAKASLGRLFETSEGEVPGSAPVVILSEVLWNTRYAADPNILGRTISIQGTPLTVIGVLPSTFHDLSDDNRLWVPITMASVLHRPDALNVRSVRLISVLCRIRDGATLEQAQGEMDAITKRLEEQYPDTNRAYGAHMRSLFRFIYYEEKGIRNIEQSVLTLLLGSAFLLLLTCVNIGGLFLLRAIQRGQEFGIRLALGGERRQVVRLLLVESLILTLSGGLAGVILSSWILNVLLAVGKIDIPDLVDVGLDPVVLAVVLLICLGAALGFGLYPAWRTNRTDLRSALQSSGKQQGGDNVRGHSLLVVSEVALAVVLLIGAGLMIRSYQILHATGIGFDTDHLLTLRAELRGVRYAEVPARIQLARSFFAEAAALPGVDAAGVWGGGTPAGGGGGYLDVLPEGMAVQRTEDLFRSRNHHVNPGALAALGIRILSGRDFNEFDTPETPLVALVSERMAKTLWPGQNPVGKRFVAGTSANSFRLEVIGVVPDIRHTGRIETDTYGDFYLSYFQRPVRALGFFLLTRQSPGHHSPTLQALMKRLDPEIAVYNIETARERFAREESQTRLSALLTSFYASVAVILVCLGIYSVLAYSVRQRTREIGIRMAFGAQRQQTYWMVLRRALGLVGTGLVLGLILSLFLTRVLRSLLFGISATDPAVYLAVALGVFLLAFLASWLPARRATGLDPVTALRFE